MVGGCAGRWILGKSGRARGRKRLGEEAYPTDNLFIIGEVSLAFGAAVDFTAVEVGVEGEAHGGRRQMGCLRSDSNEVVLLRGYEYEMNSDWTSIGGVYGVLVLSRPSGLADARQLCMADDAASVRELLRPESRTKACSGGLGMYATFLRRSRTSKDLSLSREKGNDATELKRLDQLLG